MRESRAILPALIASILLITAFLSTVTLAASGPSFNTFSNVNYCTQGGINQFMNIYTPTSGSNHPIVLWVPGGGWNTTGATTYAVHTNFGNLVGNLTQAGVIVAAVGYTGYPTLKWPAQIEEVKCAVRFLRTSTAVPVGVSINQFQVAAYGRSAGAHLTDLLGLVPKTSGWDVGQWLSSPSTVKAVVSVSGPTNLTRDSSFDTGTVTKIDTVFGSSSTNETKDSPIAYTTTSPPKFFLLYGINDTKVGYDQGIEFQKYLTSKGASSTLILVDNAGHGLSIIPGFSQVPSYSQTIQDSVNFFLNAFAGRSGPSLSLTATPSVIDIGQSGGASLSISGGTTPTGTVTFDTFSACDGISLVHTQTITVSGAGKYNATAFAPGSTRTYYWTAAYSGDANNLPAQTSCGASGSTLAVTANTLTVTTSASPPQITFGQSASAMGQIAGGNFPTGTIAFALFNAAGCPGGSQVFTSSAVVSGNGGYSSGTFVPSTAGTFYWTATYSGDISNVPGSSACGASGSVLTVSPVSTNVAVTSVPSVVTAGQPAGANVLLSTGLSPTGTVTFSVYNAAGCPSSALVFTSAPVTVNGDGTYASPAFTPQQPGTYFWVASYSGDSVNSPSTSQCGAPLASLTVSSIPQVASFSFADTPSNNDPTSGSGTVVITVTITNYGTETFTLGGSLTVTSVAGLSCTGGNALPLTGSIVAGASATFSMTCTYSGSSGQTITATIAATATDPNGMLTTVAGSSALITDTIGI